MSVFVLHRESESRATILANCITFLSQLPDTKSWEVRIKRYVKTRTSQQNRYLFGIAHPILAEAMGYDVEDVHEYCLGRHFGWVDKKVPKTPRNPEGVESVPFRTTTRDEFGKPDTLSRYEFGRFVELVQRVGSQCGVYIPDPDPSLTHETSSKKRRQPLGHSEGVGIGRGSGD